MKNLTAKMVKVMASVSRSVVKSGHNTHQKYDYVMEADLLAVAVPALLEQKIHIWHSVESVERSETITTVTTAHTFVDTESGESFTVKSVGQGSDKSDKGVYKAITGASKYFWMKSFMMAGNDDPENETNAKTEAKVESKPAAKSSGFGTFAKKAAAEDTPPTAGRFSSNKEAAKVTEDIKF